MPKYDCDYQFFVELHDGKDPTRVLGQSQAELGFDGPIEQVRFDAVRKDRGEQVLLPIDRPSVVPVWSASRSEPYLEAFDVELPTSRCGTVRRRFGLDLFRGVARQTATDLVEAGKINEGDVYDYRVFALEGPAEQEANGGWHVEQTPQSLKVSDRPLAELMAHATPHGQIDQCDVPYFVPRRLLDEAQELSRGSEVEIGGLCVGTLHRDTKNPDIVFAEVKAQLPLKHATHETARLTFTPETWKHHSSCMALRKPEEATLCWWHLHPRSLCANCGEEARKKCKVQETFSAHDLVLHATVFPRAFQTALLLSDSHSSGVTWPMFGWRDGQVARRGYYIIDE